MVFTVEKDFFTDSIEIKSYYAEDIIIDKKGTFKIKVKNSAILYPPKNLCFSAEEASEKFDRLKKELLGKLKKAGEEK